MRPFLDLNRPTDQISLAHYTALTLTGAFFSRYALLIVPVNYTICSVNIASTRGVFFLSVFSIVCLLLLLGHTHCRGLERLKKSKNLYHFAVLFYRDSRARRSLAEFHTSRLFKSVR